ncbi:copper transporter [Myceligenerans cantabricum]
MIDFRYHLVSLISVFLALAVGIILGAGPLQGALGETLTRQVDTLREERNELRAELDDTTASLGADEGLLTAAAPRLLDGALTGRRVAVVSLGDVSSGVRSGVVDQLGTAGAEVVVQAKLPLEWTLPEEESTQTTVAEGLRGTLADAGVETDEDDPVATLAAAVTLSFTGVDSTGARSDTALDLQQQLATFGLLRTADEQSGPATDVVLLAETPMTDEELADQEAAGEETASAEPASPRHVGDVWTSVAGSVSQVAGAVVLAGPATDGDEPVSRVRADDDLAGELTTVSDVASLPGKITVPLALAADARGDVDHYGPESDTSVIPPVPDE